MEQEIIIVCNSAEFIAEVSSGRWADFQHRNIFTCNNAYTHFRTSKEHFNIFVDNLDINRFYFHAEKLTEDYQNHVKFIFSDWDIKRKANSDKQLELYNGLVFSPVSCGGSSAFNALLYLNSEFSYDKIHLIGYTFDEFSALEKQKSLIEKKKSFDIVLSRYDMKKVRPSVYEFSKIKK